MMVNVIANPRWLSAFSAEGNGYLNATTAGKPAHALVNDPVSDRPASPVATRRLGALQPD
jgi:hypothetical protein